MLISLKGTGVQIYQCRKGNDGDAAAWTFVRPEAELSAGNAPVGTHGAGPFWQYHDGSRITAKLVRKADGASVGDIPWLRLAVDAHTGQGVFSTVDVVIRADTQGGALTGSCDTPGATQAVPYRATYRFIRRL